MNCAPIALFSYNRADHTQQAIESLLQNKEAKYSDLFIFSDGAKNKNTEEGVKKNREYIHSVCGFNSVTIIERSENWGLSKNLISGITEIVNKYDRVIVVEDDLIVSPFFLKYMNEALVTYENNSRVGAISAFLNPVNANVPETFFLRYFACWGWATWKRAWNLFNPDVRLLLKELRWKKNDFNIGGSGPFYDHLYCHKVGLVDTWAARFYASLFLANKLVLYPGKTLTIQSGMDGTGTHSENSNIFEGMKLCERPISICDIPVEENRYMYNAYSAFYGKGVDTHTLRYHFQAMKSFVRRLLGVDYR